MKINNNLTTIIVVVIAIVGVYFITRSDIFQMQYYENTHADNAGSQF